MSIPYKIAVFSSSVKNKLQAHETRWTSAYSKWQHNCTFTVGDGESDEESSENKWIINHVLLTRRCSPYYECTHVLLLVFVALLAALLSALLSDFLVAPLWTYTNITQAVRRECVRFRLVTLDPIIIYHVVLFKLSIHLRICIVLKRTDLFT